MSIWHKIKKGTKKASKKASKTIKKTTKKTTKSVSKVIEKGKKSLQNIDKDASRQFQLHGGGKKFFHSLGKDLRNVDKFTSRLSLLTAPIPIVGEVVGGISENVTIATNISKVLAGDRTLGQAGQNILFSKSSMGLASEGENFYKDLSKGHIKHAFTGGADIDFGYKSGILSRKMNVMDHGSFSRGRAPRKIPLGRGLRNHENHRNLNQHRHEQHMTKPIHFVRQRQPV